jgi:hypothetical protein
MTSVFLSALMQIVVVAAGTEATPVSSKNYTEARKIVSETGSPLVVMVTTDSCVHCQTMKKKVLPRVFEGGFLRKVVFSIVNPDRESELAEKLIGDGPVPQLVMFRKKGDGWVRKTLVGGQSVEKVEQFIQEGVNDDQKEHDSPKSRGS